MIYHYRGLVLGPSLSVTQGEYDVLSDELKKEYILLDGVKGTVHEDKLPPGKFHAGRFYPDSLKEDEDYDDSDNEYDPEMDEDIDDENNPDEGNDINDLLDMASRTGYL